MEEKLKNLDNIKEDYLAQLYLLIKGIDSIRDIAVESFCFIKDSNSTDDIEQNITSLQKDIKEIIHKIENME